MVDNEVNYDERRDIRRLDAGCFFLALTGTAVGAGVRVMALRWGLLWVLLAGKVPGLFSSELEAGKMEAAGPQSLAGKGESRKAERSAAGCGWKRERASVVGEPPVSHGNR